MSPNPAGARIVISRAALRSTDRAPRRTLKTGYCNRKIDKDRLAKFESEFTFRSKSISANPRSAGSYETGRLRNAFDQDQFLMNLNGEFDPGSG